MDGRFQNTSLFALSRWRGLAPALVLFFVMAVGSASAGDIFYSRSAPPRTGVACDPGAAVRAPRAVRPYRFGYRSSAFGYGTYYGANFGYFSKFDFGSERLRAERRAKSEQRKQELEAERVREAEERRLRRLSAYQSRPAEVYEVTVYGYNQRSYEEVAQAVLAENQRRARSRPATEAPAVIPGMTLIGIGDSIYYYGDGVFYEHAGGGELLEVDPPVDAMVFELPEGAERVHIDGEPYYRVADAYFRRIRVDGLVLYKVAENPEP
jgi:hypothetical protein